MSTAGLFRITRPTNAAVAGLAVIVAYLIATGTLIPSVLLLFTVVVLITAAGNVINDFFDVEIDRVNRPDRPIPSGQVTLSAARAYAVTLFLAGFLVCLPTNTLCIAIAVFNSFLLIAYAARLKRLPLVGNLAVAYLSGSMFLFGGALNGLAGITHVLPFAVMTFFAMLARELVKAAEDIEGDRASGAATFPIRYGIRATGALSIIAAVLGTFASLIPYWSWGIWYLAGILIVDAIILAATLKAARCPTAESVRSSGASMLLKIGMFASLIVFTLSALFL
ncbi:MAG: geranylgeranylglycerol-phosphate geranylgeranyltransferase [Methanoregula sp.]|jgi:geranylgeranylglycerol-phosphate geranylgeranyltransferase|nr:geranylgeranylglycerol-phosphate geranylgeranyltransferase [Methanoregula sp.]